MSCWAMNAPWLLVDGVATRKYSGFVYIVFVSRFGRKKTFSLTDRLGQQYTAVQNEAGPQQSVFHDPRGDKLVTGWW